MSKKILVTGSEGFIGSHLVECLVTQGYDIKAFVLYNSFNNHGSVGLINTPTARFYNEGVHGVTIYDGTPDQKITLSSNP